MFLLQILKKKSLYKYLKELNYTIKLIKNLKEEENSKQFTKALKLTNQKINIFDNNHLSVRFIINIIKKKKNTIINITDIKGNLKVSYTAGVVDLTGKQKKKKIAILLIVKFLLSEISFLKNQSIAIHFKNVNKGNEKTVIKMLKNELFINSIVSYRLQPHNGCRPKKIKRKKRKFKFFKKLFKYKKLNHQNYLFK